MVRNKDRNSAAFLPAQLLPPPFPASSPSGARRQQWGSRSVRNSSSLTLLPQAFTRSSLCVWPFAISYRLSGRLAGFADGLSCARRGLLPNRLEPAGAGGACTRRPGLSSQRPCSLPANAPVQSRKQNLQAFLKVSN